MIDSHSSRVIREYDRCLNDILINESHLIETIEIERYLALSTPKKSLLWKIFNRQFKWLRVSKLNYSFDEEMENMIPELTVEGYIDSNGATDDEFVELLLKSELIAFLPANKLCKVELRDLVRAKVDIREIKAIAGQIIRISIRSKKTFEETMIICQKLRYWPSDNFATDIILSSLHDEQIKRNYVNYQQSNTSLVWPEKSDFIEYAELLQLEHQINFYFHQNNTRGWLKIVNSTILYLPLYKEYCLLEGHVSGIPFLSVFMPGWVLTRILSLAYEALFRLKYYKQAVTLLNILLGQNLYRQTQRGYWFTELAKLLDLYIDRAESKVVIIKALSGKLFGYHRSILIKRLDKIKKTGAFVETDKCVIPQQTIYGTRFLDETARGVGQKVKMLGIGDTRINVEEFALEYYCGLGYNGIHSENSILLTLFGLLFWDIIFDDTIPCVFCSPYQIAPLDLNTEFFYTSRKASIDARLKQIMNNQSQTIIEDVCRLERPLETKCVGVNWKKFTDQDILEIIECIGPPLSKICENYAKSFSEQRGGVPDLCLWNITTKEVKFVEVKSKNDRVSPKQLEWLASLNSIGVQAEILNILYED